MGCLAGFEHPGQGAADYGGRVFSVPCRRNFLDRRPFAVGINERSLSRRVSARPRGGIARADGATGGSAVRSQRKS